MMDLDEVEGCEPMSKITLLLSCTLALSVLPACDPPEDEDGAAEPGEDPFGEDVAPRCAINGYYHYSAPLVADPGEVSFSASMSKTSPSASYASTSCGDYYVVQGTNVQSFPQHEYLMATASVATPLTAGQCVWAVLSYDVSIYYDGAWHQRAASWVTGDWNGSSCVLGVRSMVYDPNDEAEKVQIAAKVKYLDASGEHYAKVKAGVVKSSILLEVQ